MKSLLNLKFNLIAFLAIALLITSCGGGGGNSEPELNPDFNNTELFNFMFSQEHNSGLTVNANSISGNGIIFITVPEGVSLSSLVPSFSIGNGATVHINNQPVESGKTAVDVSNTSEIRVTSESGSFAIYTLLARNGNARIDNKVYSFMKKHNLPGVSVAISKDEATVYAAGYGFAVKENKTRVTPTTLFRLASMSKQQTALAIMTLYEQGKLKLDDKVFGAGGILEDEFGTNVHNAAKKMTVKHMLSHTAGWSSDPIYTSATTTLEERIQNYVTNVIPDNEPGKVFDYNNLGFCILGKIVEKVSGMKYEDFLAKEVHAKAGVSNIFVGKNTVNGRRSDECRYYGQDGRDPYGNDVEMSKAAGGMIANVMELMKLMAHIDYGTKVPDILKKETLDLMYTKVAQNGASGAGYALGWRVDSPSFPDWQAYHGGTLAGVCTIWSRTDNNVNGVVLCNSRSYSMSIDDDMWYMLRDIQYMF